MQGSFAVITERVHQVLGYAPQFLPGVLGYLYAVGYQVLGIVYKLLPVIVVYQAYIIIVGAYLIYKLQSRIHGGLDSLHHAEELIYLHFWCGYDIVHYLIFKNLEIIGELYDSGKLALGVVDEEYLRVVADIVERHNVRGYYLFVIAFLDYILYGKISQLIFVRDCHAVAVVCRFQREKTLPFNSYQTRGYSLEFPCLFCLIIAQKG